MPWKNPENRRLHRRATYQSNGKKRDWGVVEAICPVCSTVRSVTKNTHGITKLPKHEGRVIKRCRSCSKRKDYAPWFDAAYVRERHAEKRAELKVRAIQYLGGKCLDCGLLFTGRNSYAFDFHHRDPRMKDFLPTAKTYSWERARGELDKCDLLCAICHRGRHFTATSLGENPE